MNRFFVIEDYTETPALSWSDKTENAEGFETETDAIERAKQLAEKNPGYPVAICRVEKVVVSAISAPSVSDVG